MIWKKLKTVPKFAFVAVLIVVSTVAFALWWMYHSMQQAWKSGPAEDIRPRIARIEANPTGFLLVDNDLYELASGAIVFKNWLKEGMPGKLFYDGKAKRFLAQYERGFIRYDLGGTVEATLVQKTKPAFSDDYKWMVYAKDKDVWRADVDWQGFKLVNEKKLTSIEQFNEMFFAANIFLGTEKTLVVRNMNNLLRVNLETGDVKPTQISLLGIAKRKSPDGKSVAGVERGQFFCYDVDSEATKTVPIGRGAINDYLWLDNDHCAAISAGKTVVLYDRIKNTLEEVAALPAFSQRIGEPSPDGRFAFCASNRGGVLLDFKKKSAVPVKGGAGVTWVSDDTFAFSREVPDSDLRGMWLQTAGQDERRISPEPYLVGKSGPMVKTLKSARLVVFETKHGIATMKMDGTAISESIKLGSAGQVVAIENWIR